jgi:uncharacterized protein involved in outer membrane biogenesis
MKTTKLLLKIFLSLLFLYGLLGFFVLPDIIKEQLVIKLEKVIARKIELKSVSFNPYTFELNVNEFIVHGRSGERIFAGAKEINVNIDPLALAIGHVKVKLIEITAPFITIHKNQDCQFNFSDLLVTDEKNQPKEEKAARRQLPKVLVDKFSIIRGKINFIDESGSEPFEASLKPIDFRLRDFSTMKEHDNQLSLHVEVDDGAYIDYRGKVNSLDPLRLEGGLELHSGRLYTQWKYFRDSLGFIVADGALDASLHYSADLSADPMQININQYKLQIDSLRLQDLVTKEDVLKMPLLALEGDANITSKQINVKGFQVDGFALKVSRDQRGALNWSSYFPPSEPNDQKDDKDEKNPWKVDIAKVDIRTDKLTYEENFSQAPFTVGLEHLSFDMQDVRMHESNIIVNRFDTNLSAFSLTNTASEKEWMHFKTLTLGGQLQKREKISLGIEQISLDKLDVYALMDREGVLNFSRLAPKSETQKDTSPEAEPFPLEWKVDGFTLNDSKLDFHDKFNAVDGLIQLDRISVSIDDLNSIKGSWAKSSLSLRMNKTGLMHVQSQIRQTPLKINSDFRLTDLDLVSFQPYAEKRANMDINSGRVDLDFKAELNEESTKVLANTRISNLNLSERREGKTFFAFKKLLVKSIDLSLKPDQMKIAEVNIYEPYARVKIDADKTTNLDGLMIAGSDSEKEERSAEKPFAVFIGKVNFKTGKGEFSDLSLPLPFKTDIHDLNGNMLALGNLSDVKTAVDIDGVVDEYGLAKIKGGFISADPKIFTDMQLKFQNIDMTNLSPYTGKFIGYELKEGKMNVELDYKIDKSAMQGGNRVVLKRLTLGDEVESEDAISAPVGLAIALLQDSDGVIDLDVPVTGNVDEPEFAIGHVVWTAFKNLIVGVATAPFKFLGDMLGISAEELENIAFEPGKSKLLPPEREKLDKLSEALSSKKMLILKVAGSYDDSRDLIAMKTARLYEEALLKLEDDTIDLSLMDRDELDDLFKEMYVSHFGEESLDLKEEKVKKLDMDAAAKKSELRRQIKDALIDTQKVSAADLVQLGQKRAQTIVSHLVSKGIDPTRLEVPSSVKSGSTGKENEYIPTKLELGAR